MLSRACPELVEGSKDAIFAAFWYNKEMTGDIEQQRNDSFEGQEAPAEQIPEESEDASAKEHAQFVRQLQAYVINHADKHIDSEHVPELINSLKHLRDEQLSEVAQALGDKHREADVRIHDVESIVATVQELAKSGSISSETLAEMKDGLRTMAEAAFEALHNVDEMEGVVQEADTDSPPEEGGEASS
ncbi:hypothetical protein COW95_02680 [Candidatus Peregrinibacteria bacterium CG22_combo_CG10-13_8_21_14_all_49_11]|nr:MAG: hypothetical protein COW95_02680 [Candidatus Peregrinibacteria bacterium CG22_combo_CG10-13_8_21_14_all_49_11]